MRPYTHPLFRDVLFDRYWLLSTSEYLLKELYMMDNFSTLEWEKYLHTSYNKPNPPPRASLTFSRSLHNVSISTHPKRKTKIEPPLCVGHPERQ